jgi:hypothetical protein
MHVKIFCGQLLDLEAGMNDWLKEIDHHFHIVDIKTLVIHGKAGPDSIAVFIFWDER